MQKQLARACGTSSCRARPEEASRNRQPIKRNIGRHQRRERNVRTLPSGKRILFVDDDGNIRLTLPLVLKEHGFQVTSASSVQEVEDLIKAQDCDVLLCDLNIEREDEGFKVLEGMRETNPNCVAIFITAYPALETAHRAIQHDIDGYVMKPADIEELVGLIERKLLARRIRANGASSSFAMNPQSFRIGLPWTAENDF